MVNNYGVIMICGIFLVIIAGCVSSPGITGSSPVTSSQNVSAPGETIIGYSMSHANWIRIDPIPDIYQPLNGSNSGDFINISGTTNYPEGSLLQIEGSLNTSEYRGRDESWSVQNIVIPVQNNPKGNNTFTYRSRLFNYFMNQRLHLGKYQVKVTKANTNVSATAFFNVLQNSSDPVSWIDVDSIPVHNVGDSFTITGTTNLPTGSVIAVNIQNSPHSCPVPVADSRFQGWMCSGQCESFFGNDSVPVLPGFSGHNTWSMVLNTTGWCVREKYDVWGTFKIWKNVSSEMGNFTFHYP
jgi:hypothetical protein